jgi:hypothetical protein
LEILLGLRVLDEKGQPFVGQLFPNIGQIFVVAPELVGGGSGGSDPALTGALTELLDFTHGYSNFG